MAAQPQSPRATVEIERNTREFYRTDHLHVHGLRHLMGIKGQRERMQVKCSTRFFFAKRFGAGQWSFLGPGSGKKWYSISEDSPQGEWDKMAEKMMVTLAENGRKVFRAMSPLSRGVLKSKGGGKLSIHHCAEQDTIKSCFSHNYFCKPAQSVRCSRRNV